MRLIVVVVKRKADDSYGDNHYQDNYADDDLARMLADEPGILPV